MNVAGHASYALGTGRSGSASEPRPQPEDERLWARGIEFSRHIARAQSLDEVYWALTNDIRGLVGFDRCFLIMHLGGASKFVAANSLPTPDKKSGYYARAAVLARSLKDVNKPFLVAADRADQLTDHGFTSEQAEAVKEFTGHTYARHIFVLPILGHTAPIAHLMMEFIDSQPPSAAAVQMMKALEPIFGCSLQRRWLLKAKPSLHDLIRPRTGTALRCLALVKSRRTASLTAAALIIIAAGFVPYHRTVGGFAQLAPAVRHMAFTGVEGLIERVTVTEGSQIEAGRILALTDSKELRFKIGAAQREDEILTKEIAVLAAGAAARPGNLAQAELLDLHRRKVLEEHTYLQDQTRLLQIRSPVSGVVTTKSVESLVGKRFNAGEPFCEIAANGDLAAEVYVPDSTVTRVRQNQTGVLYLNSSPLTAIPLVVERIAPKPEALPRLGNVYRVRAAISVKSDELKCGMKGVGKIHTGAITMWRIVVDRIALAWLTWRNGPTL